MKRPDKEIGNVLHEKSGTYPSQYHDTILAYIAHLESQLPPRKTVSDAVDCFDGVWPKHAQDCEYMSWTGFNFAVTRVRVGNHVCTREEFKAEVERRKGEEWTHRTNAGERCKIHVKEPDVNGVIIVLNERGEYLRHNSDSLKPIKPSISKVEADAVKAWYAWLEDNDKSGLTSDLIEEYISEHEVK